jgi:hypothetical protein
MKKNYIGITRPIGVVDRDIANLDVRYGTYVSIAEALENVPISMRTLGLTVGIVNNGIIDEYWWKSGLTDADLIEKQISGDNIYFDDGAHTIIKGDTLKKQLDAVDAEFAKVGAYLTDLQITYTATTATITGTLVKSTTSETSTFTRIVPLVTNTTVGMMPPEAYRSLLQVVSDVEALKNNTGGYIGQSFATYAALQAYTIPAAVIAGMYTWVLADETHNGLRARYICIVTNGVKSFAFEYTESGTGTIGIATSTATGVVKGTDNTVGKVFVEVDGTMSVNGWDQLNTNVNNKASKASVPTGTVTTVMTMSSAGTEAERTISVDVTGGAIVRRDTNGNIAVPTMVNNTSSNAVGAAQAQAMADGGYDFGAMNLSGTTVTINLNYIEACKYKYGTGTTTTDIIINADNIIPAGSTLKILKNGTGDTGSSIYIAAITNTGLEYTRLATYTSTSGDTYTYTFVGDWKGGDTTGGSSSSTYYNYNLNSSSLNNFTIARSSEEGLIIQGNLNGSTWSNLPPDIINQTITNFRYTLQSVISNVRSTWVFTLYDVVNGRSWNRYYTRNDGGSFSPINTTWFSKDTTTNSARGTGNFTSALTPGNLGSYIYILSAGVLFINGRTTTQVTNGTGLLMGTIPSWLTELVLASGNLSNIVNSVVGGYLVSGNTRSTIHCSGISRNVTSGSLQISVYTATGVDIPSGSAFNLSFII